MDFSDARFTYAWLGTSLEKTPTETPQAKIDALFILGSGSESPIYRAVALHRELSRSTLHRPPPIAFSSTGGVFGGNLVWGCTEMEHYRRVLEMEGIPRSAIVHPPKEKGTTNTLVEAQQAIPFLAGLLGFMQRHIVLCARPVHQRRAWLTFSKQHPGITYTNCPGEEPLSIELLPRIMGELKRIREYAAKGDIARCDIPARVIVTEEKLRAIGISG